MVGSRTIMHGWWCKRSFMGADMIAGSGSVSSSWRARSRMMYALLSIVNGLYVRPLAEGGPRDLVVVQSVARSDLAVTFAAMTESLWLRALI